LPNFLNTTINFPFIGETNLAIFLVYVVASMALIIFALMLVHKRKFKEIFMKSI
jgi:hypothetical protein